jgi:signal transduction histidine kinase
MRPAFATATAIAGGNLASRVALSGRGDEFDRLAATMNTMLDRMGTLMEGVRGVSDAIAHDLRTPIARVRAKLEDALAAAGKALREGAAGGGPADSLALRAAVEQGIADLDGISRIFQALLRIAEAEAGARRAAFATLDLVPVLADAAELYEAAAEARGQRLTTNLPERLELVGDRDLLLQAVANLLDNAIKFTPPGGTVELAAHAMPGSIEVVVADDGPGLSPEDRSHAGERFFRADKARATPGSGLGLSLVQAVAHLHGGQIRLEDAVPGREPPGLRVVLRLPVP